MSEGVNQSIDQSINIHFRSLLLGLQTLDSASSIFHSALGGTFFFFFLNGCTHCQGLNLSHSCNLRHS